MKGCRHAHCNTAAAVAHRAALKIPELSKHTLDVPVLAKIRNLQHSPSATEGLAALSAADRKHA